MRNALRSPGCISLLALASMGADAQTPACTGAALAGTVHDPADAIIPAAQVTLDGGAPVSTDNDGRYHFVCIAPGQHQLHVTAQGFADTTIQQTLPHSGAVDITLQVQTVQTSINVDAGGKELPSDAASSSPAAHTLAGRDLQTLADDPDDLARELQQLAATAGANPASTLITVDGFQNESALPPKSSIANIKFNPDLYSAEYREPPFEGGRVEVYTKPGQPVFHGALFTTNGSSWMNARNPFSVSEGTLGKQRYGAELSGPVRRQGSDFALSFEHRQINDTAVVNAVTLDPHGNQQSVIDSVPIPQTLWLATARNGWQLGAKNTFTAEYSANVNHLLNQGVGGTALRETGYANDVYEHNLRLSNITLASAKRMHEARVSLQWTGNVDAPNSAAPQVQVAGAFTEGGSTTGAASEREFILEADDDAVLDLGNHLLKLGIQFRNIADNDRLTSNFNGTYIFGGGAGPALNTAGDPIPGQSVTITGEEQYRRSLLHLPGGTPTAFSSVVGSPGVSFDQIRVALFVQDGWKLRPNLQLSLGLRYFLQDRPATFASATPRFGVAWSPGKSGKWKLDAHAGLFAGQYHSETWAELQREDGVHRITSTVYNPVFGDPLGPGAPVVHAARSISPHLTQASISIESLGIARDLPYGLSISLQQNWARIWNYSRTQDINQPLTSDPYGPRPGPPNLDILQLNNSGQGGGTATFAQVSEHGLKNLNFFAGAVRVNIKDDTDDSEFFQPQNARTDAGEFALRTGNSLWQIFGNGSWTTPGKLTLSTDLHAGGATPYNVLTGFDNNGDGNFNDRPQYAFRGQPEAVQTPFGLLIASGGQGVFPRNAGRLPWTVYMDVNAQRAWTLPHSSKAEHPQTLTFNIRSSNLLNHTNVTAVGNVLGSPLFNQPYAADNSRRVEAGARYSF